MVDISKCNGNNCTLKNKCYRFKAKANPLWQSYAEFSQDPVTKECDYFLEIVKEKTSKDTSTCKKKKLSRQKLTPK